MLELFEREFARYEMLHIQALCQEFEHAVPGGEDLSTDDGVDGEVVEDQHLM